MPHISIKNIYFSYENKKKTVLNGINLDIARGEIVTLLGPNGCGKSTLIKLMLGLLRPEKGDVCIGGIDISCLDSKTISRTIAYVPQIHRSYFPYSVLDIVLMGRIPYKTFFYRYTKEDMSIANDAMERLSIVHLAERPYTELSGGERQLTIVARAITQGAKTLIMDEPATGLDYGNQLRLLEEMIRLSQEGYTFIKSTHSPEHALWIADRAVMIKNGTIMADGRCDLIINSENMFELYNAKVKVMWVNDAFQICVPRVVSNFSQADEIIDRKKAFVMKGDSRDSYNNIVVSNPVVEPPYGKDKIKL
ncbi:MAG TPA: ABC transporter ATP-binding protein [Syntrophorhabdaceae bacterium]|nr:ABC transporter ATP-binding protein [Syntrophorhabdaceae bacterium]